MILDLSYSQPLIICSTDTVPMLPLHISGQQFSVSIFSFNFWSICDKFIYFVAYSSLKGMSQQFESDLKWKSGMVTKTYIGEEPLIVFCIPFFETFLNHELKGVCHEIFRVLFWHVWIDRSV
jgi:hypothetical protein